MTAMTGAEEARIGVPCGLSGPCAHGDRIQPGDLMRKRDDGQWEHVECPAAEQTP